MRLYVSDAFPCDSMASSLAVFAIISQYAAVHALRGIPLAQMCVRGCVLYGLPHE